MNRIITILLTCIAVIKVTYSFVDHHETARILGFEMNIWMYRLIWTFISIGFGYSAWKAKQNIKE
ncbi:hypothetical protein [Formosa algae]|uniref:hypothetical protein n=1 Tax=Formosa algae TaxID=225843 RepID=UPI000CCFB1A1|nr:hypothetical protein [Formosa algae]PNW28689.1 hypothetical protein BKP44_07145 [Formosa algae]